MALKPTVCFPILLFQDNTFFQNLCFGLFSLYLNHVKRKNSFTCPHLYPDVLGATARQQAYLSKDKPAAVRVFQWNLYKDIYILY
jgi:hypothetical protein